MKTTLTIAGSDCSGGAGIQADLKTMLAHGVYGMSAITALTAQNTTGVTAIFPTSPDFLTAQLERIFTDIFPDAVKIGMVSSCDLIAVIAKALTRYKAKQIVLDPVMVATSGAKLIPDDAIHLMTESLFPLADLITPNIPEAQVLTNQEIRTAKDMMTAAQKLSNRYGTAVLIKGGHQLEQANDYLYTPMGDKWFFGKQILNPNTHGTGCTLSSAIACNLAKGHSLPDSIDRAKQYVSGALLDMLDLGKGSGPLNHGYDLKSNFID